MNNEIILIAHNLRSIHNVGSLLRTADGLGLYKVFLTGYTPYPKIEDDQRLPYVRDKVSKKISKTSLGAENYISWEHRQNVHELIEELKHIGFQIIALEQDKRSINLETFMPKNKIVLIVGREVEGIEPDVLDQCDDIVMIPMLGSKESFNVVQAAAMTLYKFRYFN